jgi:hypothetical protein
VDDLRDEHVIPIALGGHLVLPEASCGQCEKVTGDLERRLLRGLWWPYRRALGLPSRRPEEQPDDFPAILERTSGERIPVRVAAGEYPPIFFLFMPPALLSGVTEGPVPCEGQLIVNCRTDRPQSFLLDGRRHVLAGDEKLEFPADCSASDVARFVSKVALGYAVRRRGLAGLREILVRDVILGRSADALGYVGCVGNPPPMLILPDRRPHGLAERPRGDLLCVYVHLFRNCGPSTPVYEVVVGRLPSAD